MQGCQLLRIAWREESKHEEKKINILQFFLHLRPSSCVSVLTLRKSDTHTKKGEFFLDALMREILHAWREK